MDNITHSLVGATIAELAVPSEASPRLRKMFFVVGIIAANLPDADLVYARIMPPPLGYLLHHRGHTHTLVGLIGLAVMIGAVTMLPKIRALVAEAPLRFWVMVCVALLSHVVLDSWNSYGVHPFWPFDNAWYYGDAVSIFEPWLWLILGLAVGANTRNTRGRYALLVFPLALVALATVLGVIAQTAGITLLVVAVLVISAGRGWKAKPRALAAAFVASAFVALSFALTHTAYARVAEGTPHMGTNKLLDVVLTPLPAQPLCRSALVVEKNEARGVYFLRRGHVSLAPEALHWLGCDAPGTTWSVTTTHSLQELRGAFETDCWMRDWMQFGRAPSIEDGFVTDARFGERGRGGFTSMQLSSMPRSCPAHETNWDMPRVDLLSTGKAVDTLRKAP